MIAILSPAKNMRSAPERALPTTRPQRGQEAEELADVLCAMPAYELESTMQISPALALRAAPILRPGRRRGRDPAILAYDGLAYKYLDADNLTDDDLCFAQNHLRHMSALYGALRPLDVIHPYRLEMSRRPRGMNLYKFWGSKFRDDLYAETDLVVNLASSEYSRAVSKQLKPGDRFLTCEFLSERGGKCAVRQPMPRWRAARSARYIIQNRIDRQEDLTGFDELGFAFAPSLSNDAVYTYVQQL